MGQPGVQRPALHALLIHDLPMPHPAADVQYRLACHVRACRIGNQVILLDLLRNQYVGLAGAPLDPLVHAVAGWPPGTDDSRLAGSPAACEATIGRLLRRGWLAPGGDAPWPEPSLEPAQHSVEESDAGTSVAGLLPLWWSTAVTAWWLRRYSLFAIQDRILRLRGPDRLADASASIVMAQLVNRYRRLRPFGLTTHDRCLHESLTLLHLLSRNACFPRWVIGVRTQPFAAHAWVQSGSLVLSDLHENVRRYQPILVV